MSNEHYLSITADADQGGGNHVVSVFHIAPDAGGWIGADKTVIANYWIGRLKAFYDACVTAGMRGGQSIGNSVIEYEYDEAPQYVAATPQTVAGGSGGVVQALQLACCVSWRTPFAGRSYRGRTFLGPLAANSVNMPLLATSFVSAVNSAAATLIAGASGTFKLSVLSKTGNHVKKNGTVTWHDGFTTHITSASTTSAIKTMRSRA